MSVFRTMASALGAQAGAVAALVALLGLAPAVFGQTAAAGGPTRLALPPGATEMVVSGHVGAGSAASYFINLAAGQPLFLSLLHLRAAPGTVGLSVTAAASGTALFGTGQGTTDFKAVVDASGDYVIQVAAAASGGGGSYDLRIDVPALVSFSPGAVAAVRSGPTPSGFPVEYVLSLAAGQTLLLDLSSNGDGVSLDVSPLDNPSPILESPLSRRLQTAVPIPSDGDYLITLYPATGQNAAYRLDMVVPAIHVPANPIYAAFPAPGHIVLVAQEGDPAGPSRKSVYSSIDNGATWRRAISPGVESDRGSVTDLPADGRIVGVTFRSGTDGFLTVTASRQADGSLGPCLYATADGGATWRPVEMPLPKEMKRGDIASLSPSAPRFLSESQGFVDVQLTSARGASQQVRYMSADGGGTWSIQTGVAAPFVPDVVESQTELTACLSDNQLQGAPNLSQKFGDKTVGKWIEQVQKDFSMPVTALSASISPDRQRLALAFAGCHTSQVRPGPFTVFAVINARGRISYFHDQAGEPSYFDAFTTANSKGAYQFFGWLADSRTILISASPYDLGAGGSCEPTNWASYGSDGQPGATFQTVGGVALAKGNKVLFYVGPGACQGALNEIHEVQTTTGQDTVVYIGSQDAVIQITGASQGRGGAIEVRYRMPGGKEQRVTVP